MYFSYKAKNAEGKAISGLVEAANEPDALTILKDHDFSVTSIQERKKSILQLSLFNKIPSKDVVILARQLSVMVSANVPIVESMKILVNQTQNVSLRSIVSSIADEVEGGTKLSIALSKYPKVFNNFFVAMVRSGETSGQLSDVLNYLADQLEKDHDLSSRIKGAMIYPAFILSGLLVVGVIMMVFVVPKITGILRETGTELPITTRLLIGTSDFFVSYWIYLIVFFVGAIFFIRWYISTRTGKLMFDQLILRIPVFGSLMRRIYIVRFTQSMQTLIAGKVPLSESLKVVSDVVGNSVYQKLINETIAEVEDGSPLISVFSESKDVPPMVTQMMSIGEQTGKLDVVLEKVTHFYRREIDSLVENLVTLIEPIVMVVMGVAVGIMVAAIILPMYNLAGSF